MAQLVKNPQARRETRVPSLGWEDPLKKENPLSTLAWKIPWMEESGRLQSMGSQRVGHTEKLHFVTRTPAENLKERK